MKQNITALIIFALILTGSFFSINYTKNIGEKLLGNLKSCETEVTLNNWQGALEHINITSSIWEKNKPYLSILFPHRDIAEINDLIIKISSLIRTQEKTAYITENKRLAALVENMSKQDVLTFENLF